MAFELDASAPRIFRLPTMGPDTWIAAYEATSISHPKEVYHKPQAHFLYTGHNSGRAVLLIEPGAYLRAVFRFNGSWYVHYQVQCRDACAFGGDSVVRFSGKGFESVMVDFSGST